MSDDTSEKARQQFLDGLQYFQAGRFPQAAQCFEASLALVPGRISTMTNLGATRVRLGQMADAQPLLEKVTAAEPGNLEAWFNLGLVHKHNGQPDLALTCFDRALAIDPGSAPVLQYRGQLLSLLARPDEALSSFDKAVAAQPLLGEAWSDRGTLLRGMGRMDEAATSFEKAIAAGADPQLNAWFLAAVRGDATARSTPRNYVERLFDDYAEDFTDHLVGELQYRAHETLIDHLLQMKTRHYRSVLDLGCGTGLCGLLITPVTGRVDGVDISLAMVAQARATNAYTLLVHEDIADFLRDADRSDDLVLAADVFVYVGDLDRLFTGVARVLEAGGQFCFTVEPATGDAEVQLLPSLRYAHSENYIRRLADQHGFEVDASFRAALRNDGEGAVEGLYFYLSRS
ncbi:tetratricopeptide repeat protein [soil metagenome]